MHLRDYGTHQVMPNEEGGYIINRGQSWDPIAVAQKFGSSWALRPWGQSLDAPFSFEGRYRTLQEAALAALDQANSA